VGVNASSGDTVTINEVITPLNAGDVIGLCSFPAKVQVNAVRNDGSIEVSASGLLHEGDLVKAFPGQPDKPDLALVTKVADNLIWLAEKLPLSANDTLSVVSIRGAVEVTKGADDKKVVVTQPERVGVSDFLADITGWRQMQRAAQFVSAANDQVALSSVLDGLLLNDTVGLASVLPVNWFIPFIQLRLNQPLGLLNGDEVLVMGFNRLKGETQTVFAIVAQIIHETNTIFLACSLLPTFTFRPADISASVLFVRGKALALIQKQDLFVSWLAVGEPDQMPRTCAGTEVPECACTQEKE
jgi:hypothetical protein